MAGAVQKIAYSHCNICGGSTHHDVLAAEKQEETDGEGSIFWLETYELLKCRGCDSIKMRQTMGFQKMMNLR